MPDDSGRRQREAERAFSAKGGLTVVKLEDLSNTPLQITLSESNEPVVAWIGGICVATTAQHEGRLVKFLVNVHGTCVPGIAKMKIEHDTTAPVTELPELLENTDESYGPKLRLELKARPSRNYKLAGKLLGKETTFAMTMEDYKAAKSVLGNDITVKLINEENVRAMTADLALKHYTNDNEEKGRQADKQARSGNFKAVLSIKELLKEKTEPDTTTETSDLDLEWENLQKKIDRVVGIDIKKELDSIHTNTEDLIDQVKAHSIYMIILLVQHLSLEENDRK